MGHSATPDAGHEFNKYRLREPLSESFLGTRYRAVSNTPSNLRAASNAFGSGAPPSPRSSAFALRLLRAESSAAIDRVARAAKAVRYLDHANVLAPIQLIRAQTRLGVITQDVDGLTLAEVLRLAAARGEALPQGISLRIALDVLEGLGALHATEGDVTHYQYACGGLTPDSIHIGKDGRARLLDPGVAGAAAGVPFWGHDPVALAYTAPEQSGAEPSFDPCSDAFSIGVMLWEMLAGRSLFGAPTAAETLERLHKSVIPRVQRHQFVRGEPISAAVALVVNKALQREPTLRYLSCHELADALRASAEVGTHADIAEQSHRLSGIAGVFEAAPPPPRSGVSGSSEFEIATGRVPNISQARKESDESGDLPADLFEPDTARVNAPTSTFPEATPVQDSGTPGPITAFPISDFIPSHSLTPIAARRHYAPIAVAAAVLLGLSFLIWQETVGRTRTGSPLPAAAAHSPAAIGDKLPEPPHAPTITTEATSAPIAAPVAPAVVAEPTVEVAESPAPAPATPRRVRRARKPDPAKQEASSSPSTIGNGAPFIPDDI